jgi:GH25 family lysozyme M1 (1,4-beta-N-acetylmuramidase)
MVDQLQVHNVTFGIYTSKSQWDPIMGGSTQFSKYPLWYPHYDSNPSFSDFVSFGGWKTPSIKQYKGTTTTCSASVDLNWYP